MSLTWGKRVGFSKALSINCKIATDFNRSLFLTLNCSDIKTSSPYELRIRLPCAQKPAQLLVDQMLCVVKFSTNKPKQVMLSLLPSQIRESLQNDDDHLKTNKGKVKSGSSLIFTFNKRKMLISSCFHFQLMIFYVVSESQPIFFREVVLFS